MFNLSPARRSSSSFSSKHRAGKTSMQKKSHSFKMASITKGIENMSPPQPQPQHSPPIGSNLTSAIVTIAVGPEQRLFAAHEDILCRSPYFDSLCRSHFTDSSPRRITLVNESPEIFSAVLEFLYKKDYSPRLEYDAKRKSWRLQDSSTSAQEPTVYHKGYDGYVLRDTIVYCKAEQYGLKDLKALALRKQGLQTHISCSTILTSARFAYDHTPDSDSRLRAHYLALMIRSRHTFKRSGTMQTEMERGGKLFFDLFVALSNHIDDLHNAATTSGR